MQTEMIIDVCKQHFPNETFEVVGLSTSGDKVQNIPIAMLGGTGVFVKELEDALLSNTVDFVVHSLKDLPTLIPDGLHLAATLLRDDPRDVFVSRADIKFADLPAGSRVATSSRRRSAQLSEFRKDLQFVDVRGNVPTRLRKLDENECDAMILAAAGLLRLGFASRIAEYLDPDISVPAAGQGALAVECRADDQRVRGLLNKINDPDVWAEATAERAFLAKLGGGCSVPIGVLARMQAATGKLSLVCCVADGTKTVRGTIEGDASDAHSLGIKLAEDMMSKGAGAILDSILQRPQQPISPP